MYLPYPVDIEGWGSSVFLPDLFSGFPAGRCLQLLRRRIRWENSRNVIPRLPKGMLAILDVCTPFASSSPSTDGLNTEWGLKHGFNIVLRCPTYCCSVSHLAWGNSIVWVSCGVVWSYRTFTKNGPLWRQWLGRPLAFPDLIAWMRTSSHSHHGQWDVGCFERGVFRCSCSVGVESESLPMNRLRDRRWQSFTIDRGVF